MLFLCIFFIFLQTIIIEGDEFMIIANIIALCVLILGGINWMLIGIFSWNLLTWIFGVGIFVRILYALVGLAAIWMLIQLIVRRTHLFERDSTMRRQ